MVESFALILLAWKRFWAVTEAVLEVLVGHLGTMEGHLGPMESHFGRSVVPS